MSSDLNHSIPRRKSSNISTPAAQTVDTSSKFWNQTGLQEHRFNSGNSFLSHQLRIKTDDIVQWQRETNRNPFVCHCLSFVCIYSCNVDMIKAGRCGEVQGDSMQNGSSCAASVYRTAECSEYFQAANLCKKNALLTPVLPTFYDAYFHRMQHQKLT